ncbi:MAG TPA: hypothetical protein VG321_04390 [Solirubrobacteraceae bacterium]|nr:hypothetical protein [Solirubrobacteraceae bacterium]
MSFQSTTGRLEPASLPLTAVRVRATTLAGVAIVGIALVMRLVGHSTNYDIFVDEITYATLGRAVAEGHGVILYGNPFFLHTPAFFSLEGGLLQVFGAARTTLGLVLQLRLVNCVLGAVECGLMMVLVGRLVGRWPALAAGLFIAVDPFLLLWDGRVTLETLGMTTAVAGWLFVAALVGSETASTAGPRTARVADSRTDRVADSRTARVGEPEWHRPLEWQAVVLGGFMFGISLLTNETYAFVGVVPLAVLVALGAPVSRRRSGAMLGVAGFCYFAYWLTIVASGQLKAWWDQQSSGLQRAAGTKQISGFNQTGHASFLSRITADLHLYLVSYLVVAAIALSTAVWIVLWYRAARSGRSLTATRRLAILLSASALFYIAYAGVAGAFEEQIFYMCIMAGVPLLAVSADAVWRTYGRRDRRLLLVVCSALCVAGLAFELAVDARTRTTRDSDFPALVSYVRGHVPYGSLVDSTDGLSQFLLQDVGIEVDLRMPGVRRHPPHYVVVASGLVRQGYVKLGPGFERWLGRRGHVVFRARDRTIGELLLYRMYAPSERRSARGHKPGR